MEQAEGQLLLNVARAVQSRCLSAQEGPQNIWAQGAEDGAGLLLLPPGSYVPASSAGGPRKRRQGDPQGDLTVEVGLSGCSPSSARVAALWGANEKLGGGLLLELL